MKPFSEPKTVLIVEDESDMALLMLYQFQKFGLHTISAVDGRDALQMAQDEHPDLILLDLMVPNLHGFEICRLLKNSPQTRHIPIVIYSATDSHEDKLKGLRLGANDFFNKGISLEVVMKRIMDLIEPKRHNSHLNGLTQNGSVC